MRTRKWTGFALTLLAGCAKKDAPAAEAPKPGESKAVVAAETQLATAQSFAETVGAIGAVEARAGHFASLSAPAPTRVANVLVSAGTPVTKGQVLIELEQSGFQSAFKSAQAALTSAQASRDRMQRLVDQGITPRRELDLAVAEYAKADADLVAARRLVELSVLRAPIAGVVTRMTAAVGASADPSQVLVEIADPTALDVVLTVQPADAARIKAHDKVVLHSGQRASDELVGSGEVVDVAGVVDSASRSVAVRVHAVAAKRSLRIGETLFGEITIATRPRAIMVPLAALVPDADGFKVFIVDSASIAHARPVKVGGKTDALAEILDGVNVGERVVTVGAFGVEDGARIVDAVKGAAAPDSATKP